ncbi:MAG TPA: metalloregulator ArsR/SmtB family transcription factor [Labilithrix sp.]|nr:metalloregulator ArsR/SmtB family transcription factor [Labilithrix sp.]
MTRTPQTTNGAKRSGNASQEASDAVRTRAEISADEGSSASTRGSSTHDACGPEEHARRGRASMVSDEQLERAASIFRAAGDISRLKLLHRLSDGEWCVTELAEAAGVGLSTVSQQLRLLRAERIVVRRRAGKHIFYSLADSHVSDLIHSAIEHAAEPHGHDKHEDPDGA